MANNPKDPQDKLNQKPQTINPAQNPADKDRKQQDQANPGQQRQRGDDQNDPNRRQQQR